MLFIAHAEFHFSFYPFHEEVRAKEQGQSGTGTTGFSALLKDASAGHMLEPQVCGWGLVPYLLCPFM